MAGGMSRMAVGWDIPIHGGERGRAYGETAKKVNVDVQRPLETNCKYAGLCTSWLLLQILYI